MLRLSRRTLAFGLVLAGTLLLPFTLPVSAFTPDSIIDDFEDGDASDWGYFGGNNAGGGYGVPADRPYEGSYYLSTGWGGEGSASVFYGGIFKNFPDSAQPALPVDPWFNIWVLNQSDGSADAYTLEITLREDVNGDGWVDGTEDSIRLDTVFDSSAFDDQWVLISAPLSSFVDAGTGGNGVFDGDVDEIVIVISGVSGAAGATVEVDFDQISLTSGDPAAGNVVVFDDMEHGAPFDNGWFAFGGSVGGGGIDANNTDLPPENGGVFSLQTGWGSGGVPGFLGGFGRTRLTSLDGLSQFSFWINPDASQDYVLEINLQDDDNGDGAVNPSDDDEFQYNCVISETGPCAISGGGWQQVTIPLSEFVYDGSFLSGGNQVLDAIPVADGGNGELINIVYAVISNTGADASFRTDYWVFSDAPASAPGQVVDDFENGLPSGSDVNGISIGFYTFTDGSPVSIATSTAPPAPRPGAPADNNVLELTADVTAFAGFIHGFENEAVDTWVSQDWSRFEGFRVWVYGQGSGTGMFIDVLDNRNSGSSSDDAERYTVTFADDFVGWKQLEFPFSTFVRKEIGNGAPADGFTLTRVHGWALGALASPGPTTWYVDQAELYGVAEIPELTANFSPSGYGFEEGTTGVVTVSLNREMNSDDPAQVSVDYATSPGTAVAGRDYVSTSGTLTFVNGGPSELSLTVDTIDNDKWEGGRSFFINLSNPVDVATGVNPSATAFVEENDEFDPLLQDDFESFPYLWDSSANVSLSYLELTPDDPLARPGQGAFEGVLSVTGPTPVETYLKKDWCKSRDDDDDKGKGKGKSKDKDKGKGKGKDKLKKHLEIAILTTDSFNALDVDHTTVTFGGATEKRVDKKTGEPKREEKDVDKDGDLDLLFHFDTEEAGVDCDTDDLPLNGFTFAGESITAGRSGATFSRDFADAVDYSEGEGLSFWYYGTGSGAEVGVTLKDNRAPEPGADGWELSWAEEFNESAGTQPNPDNWTFEIGDGSINGIPGWGNDERQYYTDDPENAAMDGNGNLLLTVRESDGSLDCYYGPCEYTSSRLISQRKAEFAYGRIESRILVPEGGGLWPAFWSLGTDIGLVGWPQTGEIDFMEFVGRLPNEIFGTIHGPGYSGGQSFAGIYDFGEPVFTDYHTFTVEWEPDLITWYVDGILYHSATPGDVAPNEWVFNDAVFLLLNVAIGGNFGGDIDPNIALPQSMAVDYIRVYQAPDTAERFEASFTDDFVGWQQVSVPFSEFARSAEQPEGAPDDGLTLSEVWGYGFTAPNGGSLLFDEVRLDVPPPPLALTVSNLANSGEGTLRDALNQIGSGGVIDFDPALGGGVIYLLTGPLTPPVDVTIDATAVGGVSLDGGGIDRLLVVDPGLTVTVRGLTLTNGYGFQLGGAVINNGVLTLEEVTVSSNIMTTDAGDFWQGGGGIYNGDGSSLTLLNSSVINNTSGFTGGGVYSFFNTTTVIENSTIANNVALDVGGGLRTLGDVTVSNSTLSGNVSTVWHGGAAFITDGDASLLHSTVTGNTAPAGTTGGLFVGTFGESGASLSVTNSLVVNNGDFSCFLAPFGSGPVSITSGGGNVFTDATCNPVASDQVVADPLLGLLDDNGGPTSTHLPLAGSPAIDSAEAGVCAAADQRGVARPQGAGCDAGAVEVQP